MSLNTVALTKATVARVFKEIVANARPTGPAFPLRSPYGFSPVISSAVDLIWTRYRFVFACLRPLNRQITDVRTLPTTDPTSHVARFHAD